MSKSPQKGYRRKGCVIPTASIALILTIFVGREVYLALTATPGQAVNYYAKAAELVEKYQPGAFGEADTSENGWSALLDAIKAYDTAAATDTSGIPWGDAFEFALDRSSYDNERTEYSLEQFLSTADSALVALSETDIYVHLDRCAAATRWTRPLPSEGRLLTLTLPKVQGIQRIARASALRVHRAHDRHDDVAEVRAIIHGLALAKAISHQHTLVDRIVGMRISDSVLGGLRAALTDRPLPEQELDQIANALDRARFPSFQLAIEGQRLHILDIIQWTHTDNGRGDGRLIVSRLDINSLLGGTSTNSVVSSAIDNLSSIKYPSKKQTTTQANDLFDGFLEFINLTRQQRLNQPSSPDIDMMELPSRQIVLWQLVPALDRFINTNDRYQSIHAGTRTMVAIEQFNARNGRYPHSLDELVPIVIPTLPGDPFARNGQFIYRLLDSTADALGRPYTLYSVGYDQNDDGGIINFENNLDAFDAKASGFDYVFNLPQPARNTNDK